ncbi:predicted protein [Chaetomium globosum CBS 148.51]|uniref:Uncharacterized protein n=1 Tax=Chaetomium globosum (strain ATCC 6205 / CBS 148.51 / DSM 1962 / NBRC 6347 / NRRL 1970) TaxID=306901 RepID=Q2H552_CHAGB|nr:uncharacterized protein CHGG_06213 [Chaetomium globosum CBS 148.51]EAQ89594.1 predicted protein [Chaetomium globosum CBS 148.51]
MPLHSDLSTHKTTKLARLYLAADERADQDNGRCMIQGQDGYKWGISEKEQNTSSNWLKYGNPAFFEDIHGLKNWAAVFLRQRSLGHGVHCPAHDRFNKRRKTRGRRPRQGPQSPTPTELAASVVAQWVNYKWKIGGKDRGSNTKEVVELAWQARWEQQRASQQSTTRQRVLNRRIADEDPPALLFTDKALMRHEGLTKAQSSLLSQARIGDIGLRDYLFRVKVPEVRTPYCECGRGRETVEHLVVWCPDPPLQRPWDGREIRSHRDLQTVLRGSRCPEQKIC